ncbi:MAG TPA: chemotaxis protein CheX [Gammaproteobacteria bacterium]|nr:chemotaxis protein CheX [Gammaproteobacteria bacterium]
MDAKYINPVLTSMVNVLSTMAQLESTPGKPSLKQDTRALGVVTSIIGLEGPQARGSLAISFPKPVILDIVRRMLEMDTDGTDETACDLTGEISNMVMGGAKVLLEEEGYDFGLTIPTVQSGADHVIEHTVEGPTILLPFSTSAGEFYVELRFVE